MEIRSAFHSSHPDQPCKTKCNDAVTCVIYDVITHELQVVMRRAAADIKGLVNEGSEALSNQTRQAAYACSCALVMASQQKEHFFKSLLEPGGDHLGLSPSGNCCSYPSRSPMLMCSGQGCLNNHQDG